MPESRKLGRGLDSVREVPEGGVSEEVKNVDVGLVDPNPEQPREVFDQEALAALEASIAADGILQPIVVRPAGSRYQVVVGERRLRAAINAGRRLIPAIVRDIDDPKMLELSLVENIQREDLNPIEKARGFRNMIEKLSLTQEEAGRRTGMGRASVANLMRLLDLPEEVQEHVSRGTISMGHARALLALRNRAQQIKAVKQIVAKGLSVRQVELMGAPKVKKQAGRKLPVELQAIEDTLREALGTKVKLQGTAKRGKIIVEYFSLDDLERIIEKVGGSSY